MYLLTSGSGCIQAAELNSGTCLSREQHGKIAPRSTRCGLKKNCQKKERDLLQRLRFKTEDLEVSAFKRGPERAVVQTAFSRFVC